MRYSLIFLIAFGLSNSIFSQDFAKFEEEQVDYRYSYKREIGLDFTPLISRLVPFNLGENEFGNVGLKWKKYYYDKALRINLGASLSNIQDDNFFYLSIGYERRNELTQKWSYTFGWDVYAETESTINDDTSGFGVSPFWGFEYNINNTFFIATEGQLKIGSIDGEFAVNFVVPNAIFLFMRL